MNTDNLIYELDINTLLEIEKKILSDKIYKNKIKTYNKIFMGKFNLKPWSEDKFMKKIFTEYNKQIIIEDIDRELLFQIALTPIKETYSKIGFWSYGDSITRRRRDYLKEGLLYAKENIKSNLIVELPRDYKEVRNVFDNNGFKKVTDNKEVSSILKNFNYYPTFRNSEGDFFTKPEYDEVLYRWKI